MGVDIHGEIRLLPTGCVNELGDQGVAVGAAGVLAADGDLTLGAVETLAHTAHVHADGVSHALGEGTGAAVSNFLINRDMGVDAACMVLQNTSLLPELISQLEKPERWYDYTYTNTTTENGVIPLYGQYEKDIKNRIAVRINS